MSGTENKTPGTGGLGQTPDRGMVPFHEEEKTRLPPRGFLHLQFPPYSIIQRAQLLGVR